MPPLPVELYSEILPYLDRSSADLAAVSASTKTFHELATPLLYRHIAFHNTTSVDKMVKLLQTLRDRAADIAPLVQRLELDWTPRAALLEALILPKSFKFDLPCMSNLTYLTVGPILEDVSRAFNNVTMPALLEFHLARWLELDRGFLARHPHLKRLSLGELNRNSYHPFITPLPKGLECLRMSIAAETLVLLQGLPHGENAKLTRLDLGAYSWNPQYDNIPRILQDSFPSASQVNIFGPHASNFLTNRRAPSPPVMHVTRLGVQCDQFGASDDVRRMLVGIARMFPSARTLDFLGVGESTSVHQHLSYQDIVRFVQTVDGLGHVELVVFPYGKVYSRRRSDYFEALPNRMDDYPQILWPFV